MALTSENERVARAGIAEEAVPVLVIRAQQGDEEAFSQLVRLLRPRLEKQAFFLAGNEHQALDLLQETLLQGWKHLHRYDGRAQFFTWLCSIMAHRHYDWLRRLRARITTVFMEGAGDTSPNDQADPEEWLRQVERTNLMRHCLDQLPAAQRMVVYLRFYADESMEGIAAVVGCSIGTVKSRLFHAMQRLARNPKLQEIRYEE